MKIKYSPSAAGPNKRPKRTASHNARTASFAAGTLLIAMASSSLSYAGGETIGYSAPFLFAQFEVILQDQAAAAARAAGLTVLEPTNADGDSGKQITDVRNLVGAGAKGLIVVANDSKAIIPALDFAAAQNVPVVSIDIGPDGGKLYAIVRADNRGMGWIACTDMAKAIGDSGKVLSLQGAFSSINGRERSEGFHDCMTKEHPNIELIERPTDWDATKQAAALQTVLAANPDLKGIFQQSDYALSPTLNVLKQAGHDAKVGEPGHIYDISIDASPQALDLVRSGDLDAAISQPLDAYAKYGVLYLQDALAGKELALGKTDHGSEVVEFNGNKMDLLPAVLVTKANVDDPAQWGNQVKK
jgi:ABC-type sugar transport system substrate-binding protein